jgi:hypothetical protein
MRLHRWRRTCRPKYPNRAFALATLGGQAIWNREAVDRCPDLPMSVHRDRLTGTLLTFLTTGTPIPQATPPAFTTPAAKHGGNSFVRNSPSLIKCPM